MYFLLFAAKGILIYTFVQYYTQCIVCRKSTYLISAYYQEVQINCPNSPHWTHLRPILNSILL